VETPSGRIVGKAGGEPLLLAGDQPMRLTSVSEIPDISTAMATADASRCLAYVCCSAAWSIPSPQFLNSRMFSQPCGTPGALATLAVLHTWAVTRYSAGRVLHDMTGLQHTLARC
jgi:hypothetical protein